MSRSRVSLAVVFLSVAGVLSARQEPQFRTATDTVPIYATVLDRDGRLVTDLNREDFEVYDNGHLQTLTTFANDVQPITVVLMLDRSGSVEMQFKLIEDAAAEFVRHLTPFDKARIGSFSLKVQIDPETFTSDPEEMLDILKNRLQPHGPTPLWHAAATAMTALNGQSGRRVVLIFTDGHDAPLSDQPKVPFEEVRHRAETEDVMVYGVGLFGDCEIAPSPAQPSSTGPLFQRGGGHGGQGRGGPGRGGQGRMPPPGGRIRLPMPPLPMPLPPGRGVPGRPPFIPEARVTSNDNGCKANGPDSHLRALTEVGGGGYFELKRAADLSATFTRVANELHHQYLLAFTAPLRDGVLHRLEVRVVRPGATIRARRGYVAPQ
jgi:VWFA-related protein